MTTPMLPPGARPTCPGTIAVIVLCFNERKWLGKCLGSVMASTDDDFVVYLVDNAS